MTIGDMFERACVDTMLGMGIVFLMLSLISFVIFLFRFTAADPAEKNKAAVGQSKFSAAAEEDKGSGADDENEIIAVIAAATAAYTANHMMDDTDDYVVRSARRRN